MGVSNQTDATADPVGYFLQDMVYHGKSERTRNAYERVLREFEAFLADGSRNPRGTAITPADAGQRDCMAWVHTMRGRLAESTVATYASYLHRFYAYMTQVGAFDSNPMTLVREEMDERINKDPTRREITLPAMREFVQGLGHPLEQAVVVTLLKTGMRVGELCNVDCRDIHIEDEWVKSTYDSSIRVAIEARPNSLFVASEPSRGLVVNGEKRTASNKRKRDTVIPIDAELRRVLKRWLAIRPDAASSAAPLFVSTGDEWGKRLTPEMVRAMVKTHAREAGWYRSGGGAEENVTPHYFRHFFTTHLRDATGERGVVKYLRGDVAEDIIDTYTHNWGDRVREVYAENIYSLL
ncbi:tyrosine-type recombinase/integrase [Haladaptatus sp. DJG-WS-42]|uniref:tyrosine-type recombinase/integrase n=1 Tax=Haladaptatus sp. DJG-WS-42 TaxID=3120516 RepID=UPI0030CAFDAD